jgi:hypothetical protein
MELTYKNVRKKVNDNTSAAVKAVDSAKDELIRTLSEVAAASEGLPGGGVQVDEALRWAEMFLRVALAQVRAARPAAQSYKSMDMHVYCSRARSVHEDYISKGDEL